MKVCVRVCREKFVRGCGEPIEDELAERGLGKNAYLCRLVWLGWAAFSFHASSDVHGDGGLGSPWVFFVHTVAYSNGIRACTQIVSLESGL